VTRSEIFGDETVLLPIQNANDGLTAAPGYVGPGYRPGGLVIVSVNPAGGKDGASSGASDTALYKSFRDLRDAGSFSAIVEAFERVNALWAEQMPSWDVYQQHTRNILAANGAGLLEIAYIYVVPFRTRGDVAAKIKSNMLDRALVKFLEQLDAMQPSKIVAMDRMAEAASKRWVENRTGQTELWYYTRKRDAHSERREILAAMMTASHILTSTSH
jgi:hypothetical protein